MSVHDLLRQDDASCARVVAQALQGLNGTPAPGAMDTSRFLNEIKDLSPQDKGALMKKAAGGMGGLPPKEQAALISAGLKAKGMVTSGATMPPEQQQLVAQAADAFKDVPPRDMEEVQKVAQTTAIDAAKDPAKLAIIAKELPPEDRMELQQALVESHVVPKEQEAVLQHVLQPNGVLDQVAIAAEYLEKIKPFALQLALIPVIEWVLGVLFSLASCDIPLASWLCWDGFGMVFTVGGFYLAYMSFEAVKRVGMNPPPELQQALVSRNAASVWTAIPPQNRMELAMGAAGIVVALLGLLCQLLWAIWGILLVLDMAGCNLLVAFISKVGIFAKSALVLGLVAYALFQLKQVHDKMGGAGLGAYMPVPSGGSARGP